MSAPTIDRLIPARQLCDEFGIHRNTERNRRLAGTGPRYIQVREGRFKRVYYRRSEIIAWLEQQSR